MIKSRKSFKKILIVYIYFHSVILFQAQKSRFLSEVSKLFLSRFYDKVCYYRGRNRSPLTTPQQKNIYRALYTNFKRKWNSQKNKEEDVKEINYSTIIAHLFTLESISIVIEVASNNILVVYVHSFKILVLISQIINHFTFCNYLIDQSQ